MKTILAEIISQCLSLDLLNYQKIEGQGTVNEVYKVKTIKDNYIIRLNENSEKFKTEYKKEKWCMCQASKAGILSPEVIGSGEHAGYAFIIMNYVEGQPGIQCKLVERFQLWKKIGEYASLISSIKASPFGDKIPSKRGTHPYTGFLKQIKYNHDQLGANDSLLLQGVIGNADQKRLKAILREIGEYHFEFGLVHGDLSLRNIIVNEDEITLLDWGTAEINVVPHTELLQILSNNEITEGEMVLFLKGTGIEHAEYKLMLPVILKLNLLKRLDNYRWACDHTVPDIDNYVNNLKDAMDKVI